ncbi:BolA family transcriptional regulator [Candidatus Pelagibacter sp.]|nr:BolA family transcriptional regulator [Candidatus Pelagibacter sp.]
MDINKISKKIESKLLSDTSIRDVKIIDNTFKHLKHSSHQKGKFHIKLEINSDLLKNKNRIDSNKVIYKILSEELKTEIHSLQISFI